MKNDTQEDRKTRARAMVRELKKMYGSDVKTELNHGNNWELLVAVILSAQCTDKRVNEVTKTLFKKYKTLKDYVKADRATFEQDIKSTGFYRNKAKNILAAAKVIQGTFGGKIPRTMEEMLTIPGVARKTANVVLGNAYDIYGGIAVDTHVRRLARKFDLTDHTNPDRIEEDLMELIPKKDWRFVNNHLVLYGRYTCKAHKHDCADHPLTRLYPKAAHVWPRAK